ncbi:NrsF family protein [Rubrimonas cliftonensis]|uniref:DUF1109 domain-containing protein n=1 Tax=Rubrimonas cliftonensis TaxID=89524 RepID=A0A1H4CHY7_9RHOB|nr:NrsF family protein [Rubrimonas cliftonensis]SEA60031.1 hypothetical protein SAMN05444370_10785 [Rubrimonas cliftonensis]
MSTDALIRRLAADLRPVDPLRAPQRLALALGLSFLAAAALVLTVFGLRSDLAAGLATGGGAVKLVGGVALAAGGALAACRLSRPAAPPDAAPLALIGLAALFAAGAVAFSDVRSPMGAVLANAPACVWAIWALGLAPLGAALLALRAGAATRPRAAGAVAGVAAGGVSALAYALSCPADDPLFVAVAYGGAILALAALGALAGPRALRW